MLTKHRSRNYSKHRGSGDDKHTFPPRVTTINGVNSFYLAQEVSKCKFDLNPLCASPELLAGIVITYTKDEDVLNCYDYEMYKKMLDKKVRDLKKLSQETKLEELKEMAIIKVVEEMSENVIKSKYDVNNFAQFTSEQKNAVINAIRPLVMATLPKMENEYKHAKKLERIKNATENAKRKNKAPIK